jgi:tetratricopeptide (TPR) repeat protein
MNAIRVTFVIFLLVTLSSATDLATSYQQAAALGDAQETAAETKDYFSRALLPYYGQQYAPVLRSCFSNVPAPDNRPFSFVVAIGADGRVMQLYKDRETNIYSCLRELLLKDVFPRPPVSPYYLHIDMKFADETASGQNPASPSVGQEESLGAAARRLRAEKAEQASDAAPPDWAVGPPRINTEPISEAQLVAWAAGGVPSEDIAAELNKRGIAFLPSNELNQLLQQAGADSSVLEELSRTQRIGSSQEDPEEMAALAKIVVAEQRRDYPSAIRATVALVKTVGKNPGLYVLAGHLLGEQEAWASMAGAFSAAIQLDRDFAYSHGQLSYACYRMEQPCAKSEAEAMLALQPRSSDGHKYLGLSYMMMGDTPAALTEYEKALALGSKSPDLIYFDIGMVKEKTDFEGAVAAYHRAIAINPNNWRPFNALGLLCADAGNIDEGVTNLRKAKALAPERLDIRQNLGATFCNSGRHAEAIVEFEELLQMDPDWNMARRCLAKSLLAVGRLDEAQKVQDEYTRREAEQ